MKRRIPWVLFVAALLGVLLTTPSQQSANGQTGADSKQPLVRLQGIDRHFYDLVEMRGNVVLLSFGATWCAPCSGELIVLEQLKREYQDKPVKFFWVTVEN